MRGRSFLLGSVVFAGMTLACGAMTENISKPNLGNQSVFSIENVTHKGKDAVKIFSTDKVSDYKNKVKILPIKGTENFKNGTIEIEVAGDLSPDAGEQSRGFVGIAFRVLNNKTYEYFYVRPSNGRADDQFRRNHSVQYSSMPDYPWMRLRKEEPSKYETYADMALGEWLKIRIEVDGENADIFINDAKYPTMIVNDIKSGADQTGCLALWLEPSTTAYFRNLKVTKR